MGPLRPRRRDLLEWGALLLAVVLLVGPATLLDPAAAFGRPTRDLFDHIALLDVWTLRMDAWAFPDGGALLAPDPTGMVLAAPFLPFGRPRALTAALVLQLTLAAVAGWALGRRHGSGLVGGVAIGLSPFLLGQATSGETETVAAWPLLAMLASLEGRGPRAWALAGAFAGLAAVASWYYGAFAAVILALWLLVRSGLVVPRPDQPRDWRVALAPAVAGLLVAGPALLYLRVLSAPDELFRGPTMATYLDQHPRALAAMSADLRGLLGDPVPGVDHIDAPSALVLLLAVRGALLLWRRDRGAVLWWAGLAVMAVALALGPVVHAGGAVVSEWGPYRLLAAVPPLGLMRLPHRWLLVSSVALGVLAVRGASGVPGWLVAALILVETAWFSAPERPVTRVPTPAVVAEIDGPVLDLPARTLEADTRGRFLVWQRTHGQPVPYALLMTGWSDAVAREPLVHAVAVLDTRNRAPERVAEAAQFRQQAFAEQVQRLRQVGLSDDPAPGSASRLREQGFSLVILHLDLLEEEDAEGIVAVVERSLGAPGRPVGDALLWRLEELP